MTAERVRVRVTDHVAGETVEGTVLADPEAASRLAWHAALTDWRDLEGRVLQVADRRIEVLDPLPPLS